MTAQLAARRTRVREFVGKADQAYQEGAYDAAIEDLRQAIQLDPDSTESRDLLGRVEKAKAAEETVAKRRRSQ